MNEAWAAIIAAIAGGVFGIAGILAGIYVGRRQTTDQADVEHQQWIRGQRQQTYTQFLAAWDTAINQTGPILTHLSDHLRLGGSRGMQGWALNVATVVRDLLGATGPAVKAVESVQLLGPADAAARARAMGDGLNDVVKELVTFARDERTPDEVDDKGMELVERLQQLHELRGLFFEEARMVMAKPPSPGV
ncbi:hypothetical protein [Streptomyces sp. NPDC003720]|uniref:hypothetical protein n=1 Tax=Streptomyces sp. NPDC003720 TaxID=3364684 RepID=UPI00367852BF